MWSVMWTVTFSLTHRLAKFDPHTMASLGSSGAQHIAETHRNKINSSAEHWSMISGSPSPWHGCETWSLTLREESRLRVFENRVLGRVFGPKRDEVTGEWRKLHNWGRRDLLTNRSTTCLWRTPLHAASDTISALALQLSTGSYSIFGCPTNSLYWVKHNTGLNQFNQLPSHERHMFRPVFRPSSDTSAQEHIQEDRIEVQGCW